MGISLILLVSGLLLTITGVVLLIVRRQCKIAIFSLIVGIGVIVVPPLFVIVSTM